MALAVCLLLDKRADTAVRRLWERLEADGIPTLASHTHRRHVPHLTFASLREYDLEAVAKVLADLPEAGQLTLHLDALGTFRRSRCWLAPAVTQDLLARQVGVVAAAEGTGAELHKHYVPGQWLPHVTLAPRLRLGDLATVASVVYDVLPLTAVVTQAALIDTRTGERYPLPHLV
jgi:hypothetical protein